MGSQSRVDLGLESEGVGGLGGGGRSAFLRISHFSACSVAVVPSVRRIGGL